MIPAAGSKFGTTEIIVVGNELLNGTTLDTNSHWLSKQFEEIGVTVTRKTTVPDELEIISDAFRKAVGRGASWIFSIGGLGPTFDDMTLKGLGKALGKKVKRDRRAVQYLKESYQRRHASNHRLSAASLKMAEIPDGSLPLPNPVGSAPAVLTEYGSSKIVSLPGVPKEMKAIFRQELLPLLQKDFVGFRKRRQIWISSKGVRESQIAASISRIMKDYSPDIYLKSHPMGLDMNRNSLLNFQLISQNPNSNASAEAAALVLEKIIAKLGGKSRRISRPTSQ